MAAINKNPFLRTQEENEKLAERLLRRLKRVFFSSIHLGTEHLSSGGSWGYDLNNYMVRRAEAKEWILNRLSQLTNIRNTMVFNWKHEDNRYIAELRLFFDARRYELINRHDKWIIHYTKLDSRFKDIVSFEETFDTLKEAMDFVEEHYYQKIEAYLEVFN